MESNIRRFILNRKIDQTGVSGTGRVCEGVVMPSGKVVVEWVSKIITTTVFESLHDFKLVHLKQHVGCADIIWIDIPDHVVLKENEALDIPIIEEVPEHAPLPL